MSGGPLNQNASQQQPWLKGQHFKQPTPHHPNKVITREGTLRPSYMLAFPLIEITCFCLFPVRMTCKKKKKESKH